MKYILLVIAALSILLGCQQNPPQQRHTYEPQVTFGYVGNVYMARVYDSQGQYYLMPYNQFSSCYAHGGYNAIEQEYYTHRSLYHPYNQHVHFITSNTADARMYSSGFRESYHHAAITHHDYRPVNRTTVVHQTTIVHRTTIIRPVTPTLVKPASRMNLQKNRR